MWNCFDSLFKKKKKKKKKKLYEIAFIGESGVDTGGLSREFYNGKLF